MKQLIAIALLVGLVTGCFSLQPVANNPLPLGIEIGLDINDAGRTALGGAMGPEIKQIEGRLVQKDSAEYAVAVSVVHLLRGGEQVWTGERIRIRSEYVTAIYEKKFSRGRTAIVTAAAIGLVAFVVNQSLAGSLFGDEGKLPPDSVQTIRYHRR